MQIVAGQTSLRVVPTNGFFVGCLHNTVDHLILEPVRDELHTMRIDHLVQPFEHQLVTHGGRDRLTGTVTVNKRWH